MTKYNKYIYIFLLGLSIFYIGCKTPESNLNTAKKNIPQSYSSNADSSNSGELNWKEFFTDTVLISLIDTALKNNYDLLMTLQKIEVAKNDIRLSKGAMLPGVNLNLANLQRKFGYYTMDDAGNRVTEITPGQLIPTHLPDYFVGLQSSWEIDVWGKLRSKKKAAFLKYLSSKESENLIKTNLIAEIANTYYELLALDVELDIIEETIQIQTNMLEIFQIQKQTGLTNELAIKQFEAQVLNSKNLEFELLQKINENKNKISFLLGQYDHPILLNKWNFNSHHPNLIKTGIPSQLLRNRPDIRQSEYDLLAANLNVKAAKAAFYPSFVITGNAGFQAFNTAYLFTTPQSFAYNVLGNLTAPFINRNGIKAQFNSAKANQVEAMYKYQKTILNAYVEVSNEISNIKNLENIYKLKTEEVAAQEKSISIATDLFKSGLATYFEVLMTQRSALQSKLELVTAKKRQYNATINIYRALGGGWK